MYMTYKLYLGHVLSVERSKLVFGKKGFEFRSFFSEHMSVRLSEQHPVQSHLIFRFVYLGANPSFLNCFF